VTLRFGGGAAPEDSAGELLLRGRLAIRFEPPIWLSVRSSGRFAGERLVGLGLSGQRALQQPVEEQATVARVAAVEAEGELVEVVVELCVADGTLVGAQHPALDQRGDEVHVWQHDMRGVAAG
jgi:hypothetical protein